jgi:hypothetical protein
MASSTIEKRSPPTDDDGGAIINATDNNGNNQMTPLGKKKMKTKNDSPLLYNNGEINSQHTQQQTISTGNKNDNEQVVSSTISNQAIAYAIDNQLQPIKIECSPPLENRDAAKKFVINFFNCIKKDFCNEYPNNIQPIGFHHWWTNADGKNFYGVTNDAALCVYLCDSNHYPTQIGNIKLKPDPPKRLPPQNTIVIKSVPNEVNKVDIENELKDVYPSIFIIDDMMDTMRSRSRHIRVDFYRKTDYDKIIKNGKIGLQGQIFEIEEYLLPPKILICSKCNTPGHAKKTCQSSIDLCRRCGQDKKINNEHTECPIKCHHCGGNHVATDYKCPIIVKFRQELLSRLKTDRMKLPSNIKLFIPVDCRTKGDRNRILTTDNENQTQNSTSNKPPLINPWTTFQETNNEQVNKNDIDKSINALARELDEIKEYFRNEREKLESNYETEIGSKYF